VAYCGDRNPQGLVHVIVKSLFCYLTICFITRHFEETYEVRLQCHERKVALNRYKPKVNSLIFRCRAMITVELLRKHSAQPSYSVQFR